MECEINRLRYPLGKVFKGTFVNDLPHGVGEVKHPDGSMIIGRWDKGRLAQINMKTG